MRTLTLAILTLLMPGIAAAQSDLATIRNDVRRLPRVPDKSPENSHDNCDCYCDREPNRSHWHWSDDYDNDDDDSGLFWLATWAAASPFWGPPATLGDDWSLAGRFPRYPYRDGRPGYLDIGRPDGSSRRWAARFRAEYGANLARLERVGGHLLLSTSSRFGLDTQMGFLEERLPGGGRDHLWLGDCNLVCRFAQSEHWMWRTGLGINWLDDEQQSDFGFNFTYGADYLPRRPWVFSGTIDWGTLGNTHLFRGRVTSGVVVRGVESYAGYEYLDLGRTQTNSLIAGVRAWF